MIRFTAPFLKTVACRGGLRAFTLFEVALCLLIIGIAAAAIIPAVGSNIRSSSLRTAANVLAADIEFCASECIAQPNAPRAIAFNTTLNKYTLQIVSGGTTIKHPMDNQDFVNDFSTGRNSQLTGVAMTRIVSNGATVSTLTFDSYGKPVLTADLAITLTYRSQSLTVTVSATTGDVTITG